MQRRGWDIVHAVCDLAQGQASQGSSKYLHRFFWLVQARDRGVSQGGPGLKDPGPVIRI